MKKREGERERERECKVREDMKKEQKKINNLPRMKL